MMPLRLQVQQAPLAVVLALLTAAIFLTDLRFEYGVATWLPYFILALPVAKLYAPRILLFAVASWSTLILAKFLQMPPAGYVDTAVFNRGIAIVTLWTMAFLLYRHRTLGQLIHEEERRVSEILDGALDAVIAIDPPGRVTAWNPQAEKTFGFSRDEAHGRLLSDLIIPPSFREAHGKGLQRYGESGDGPILNRRIEVVARHKDGREFPVELSVMPLRVGRTISFCAFVRDITERKELETTLRRAREVAESASQAKSDFVANISHEIRTPLNAICGTTDLLLSTTLTGPQRRYTEMCQKASQALLHLVTDLLDFSRIESGRMSLERKPFDLRQVVDRTIQLMGPRADEKRLTLSAHVADDLPHMIQGDAFRLHQVLLNLIANALKFTSQGYISVKATPVDGERDSPRFRLSVSDSGIGIPPDQLERIFDRFTQVDSAASRQHGGVGLGLAICKRLVELMNGRIWAENNQGGSTFFVELPLIPAAATEAVAGDGSHALPAAPTVTAPTAAPSPGLHILVAEDSAESRELIHYYFQGTAHRVETVIDGDEAVSRYCAENYDLVLMDLQMPGMDGFTATRRIRAWEIAQGRTATPIIALTANAFREAADQSAAAGCTGFLTKPIARELLLSTIARYRPSSTPSGTVVTAGQPSERPWNEVTQRIDQEIKDRRPQFLKYRRKDLATLQDAAARGEYETIALLGHRMKGLSGSYGFPEIGAIGRRLESAAAGKDLVAIQTQLEQLAALVKQGDEAA
ncbi:MAG: PAS domain S-box protein [Nitrospiraceae bacterium]|nr:PAS domain S-box protein [Nitrospiraceae bacterium]